MVLQWNDLEHIILYGYGTVGRCCLGTIRHDFCVDYIIDRNYSEVKELVSDIEVLPPEEGIKRYTTQKIIVMTGGRVYLEIADYLEKCGLKEYEDYCGIEYFITNWYWTNKNKNCVLELHSAVTMDCTLKCRNCNMFVPYYQDHVCYDVKQIKNEIDLLFRYVDYVFCYTLLGGEPFLYNNLGEIIKYIGDRFCDKVAKIKIISNGTIVPNEYVLKCLKDYDVWVSISDYSGQVPYMNKLDELCRVLSDKGIEYTVNKQDSWLSFGFPESPFNIPDEACAGHMKECSPIFHGYNDGRIYYCHVSWSAEKIGRYKLQEKDYIDLHSLEISNRHNIAEHCLGNIYDGSISFCKVCGGCGKDNNNIVTPGEQL